MFFLGQFVLVWSGYSQLVSKQGVDLTVLSWEGGGGVSHVVCGSSRFRQNKATYSVPSLLMKSSSCWKSKASLSKPSKVHRSENIKTNMVIITLCNCRYVIWHLSMNY